MDSDLCIDSECVAEPRTRHSHRRMPYYLHDASGTRNVAERPETLAGGSGCQLLRGKLAFGDAHEHLMIQVR
jgi:hypothetical protein